MSAFSGGSQAHLADPLMVLARLFDLPLLLINYLLFRMHFGHLPSQGFFGIYQSSIPAPFFFALLWSLLIGVLGAWLIDRKRRRRMHDQPPNYWKSGL